MTVLVIRAPVFAVYIRATDLFSFIQNPEVSYAYELQSVLWIAGSHTGWT